MTSVDQAPDWIKPGAAVAIYRRTRGGSKDLQLKKIERVATKSFTVEGIKDRFNLSTLRTVDRGGAWSVRQYVATHPDSPDAAKVAASDERDRMKTRVFRYLRDDAESLDQVDRAIQRLTEWRAVLASEVSQ